MAGTRSQRTTSGLKVRVVLGLLEGEPDGVITEVEHIAPWLAGVDVVRDDRRAASERREIVDEAGEAIGLAIDERQGRWAMSRRSTCSPTSC